MGFTQGFIEKVRDANNIVDLVGQYTVLRQNSNGFSGRCPFPDHDDKTASFSVSEDKQLFHCFGCKKSGTVYNFVQMYLGQSFPESVEYLAGRAGLELEREGPFDNKMKDRRQAFFEANRLAYEGFREQLEKAGSDHPVKKYLAQRELSDEIIAEFGIGYSPDSWDFITKKLQKMPRPLIADCGLVKARRTGKDGFYDLFRNRLMFPILNTMGKCVGFGGRVIGEGEPKYLNSPETPLFHKGRVLYGLDRNSRYIRSQDEAIIVEGYMDLLALAQFGVRNVTATLGTALTAEHAKLLKRMTKNVLVLFDGDRAGTLAAEKSLPILLRAGVIPKGLCLPDNQDPDDYVRKEGKEKFDQLVGQAPQLFHLVISNWLKDYRGSASEKIQLVEKLAPIVAEISDPALRQLYLREVASNLNVDEKWLRSALWQQIKGKRQRSEGPPPMEMPPDYPPHQEAYSQPMAPQQPSSAIQLKSAAQIELTLLGLALKTQENFNLVSESGVSEYLVDDGVRKLYSLMLDKYRQSPENFDKLLASALPHVDMPERLSAAFAGKEVEDAETEKRLVEDCIQKVKDLHLKQRGSSLSVQVKMNPDSRNLEEFVNIHKQRLGLRKIKENYETED